MTLYIGFLLTVLAVVGVRVLYKLSDIHMAIRENTEETRELRLKSRTRIRQASLQSGAVSDEQKLVRLGRASAAHRIVVGGDSDSQLNENLSRQSSIGRQKKGGEDAG